MRNLLKSVEGSGGVFVCACEQKVLRDIVSHVICGSGDEFGMSGLCHVFLGENVPCPYMKDLLFLFLLLHCSHLRPC